MHAQVSETFPDKTDAAYQYSEVLHKSFLFYFQQRSGQLPHQVDTHYQQHAPNPSCAGSYEMQACPSSLLAMVSTNEPQAKTWSHIP